MPPIDKPAAKECVRKALEGIADFDGEIEGFTFSRWHEFHKSVFVNIVAACIRKKGSLIVLNENLLQGYPTLGDFIDFVANDSAYLGEPPPDLRKTGGDLS